MKLIVGLGNPGLRYKDTRHNAGFRVISQLAKRHQIKVNGSMGPAIYGQGQIAGQQVILLQPTTYMNRSGAAVSYAVRQKQLALADILIVYDDLDLPLGKIRLRAAGSAGGHKGIGSIIDTLGSQEINRLRIGIGRPDAKEIVDYVLEPFAKDELPILEEAVERACDAIVLWVEEGLELAASRFNG
ncbi:MAG TPA: aminoacyl-tRNA hydrolase [Firmicutes bacterium]|nr:aminoacyl-tRNA hydrolase [Bacillota bacterium]